MDGKRPDGVTIAPWKSERVHICNLMHAYETQATSEAGAVATLAELDKKTKHEAI